MIITGSEAIDLKGAAEQDHLTMQQQIPIIDPGSTKHWLLRAFSSYPCQSQDAVLYANTRVNGQSTVEYEYFLGQSMEPSRGHSNRRLAASY